MNEYQVAYCGLDCSLSIIATLEPDAGKQHDADCNCNVFSIME